MSAYILLEDGTRFDGDAAGAPIAATGEVVFNTAMSGYQESVTDPSYRGQIIVFTYPLIGNYGVAADHMESDSVHARAVIMREGVDREDAPHAEGGWLTWLADCGIPALTGVDTRALVRHIRDKGAMRGGVFPGELPETDARDRVMAEPPMTGADLAKEVTPAEPVILGPLGDDIALRIAALDTGIKDSIVRNLRERGASRRSVVGRVTRRERGDRDRSRQRLLCGRHRPSKRRGRRPHRARAGVRPAARDGHGPDGRRREASVLRSPGRPDRTQPPAHAGHRHQG